jgi:hypothetical protein
VAELLVTSEEASTLRQAQKVLNAQLSDREAEANRLAADNAKLTSQAEDASFQAGRLAADNAKLVTAAEDAQLLASAASRNQAIAHDQMAARDMLHAADRAAAMRRIPIPIPVPIRASVCSSSISRHHSHTAAARDDVLRREADVAHARMAVGRAKDRVGTTRHVSCHTHRAGCSSGSGSGSYRAEAYTRVRGGASSGSGSGSGSHCDDALLRRGAGSAGVQHQHHPRSTGGALSTYYNIRSERETRLRGEAADRKAW